MQNKQQQHTLGKGRKPLLMVIDLVIFLVMDGLYLLLSPLTSNLPSINQKNFWLSTIIMASALFLCRITCRVYRNVWRYTSTNAYFLVIIADMAAGLVSLGISLLAGCYTNFFHYLIVLSCTCIAALSARFAYRLLYKHMNQHNHESTKTQINVAIIGAGQIGALLANDLLNNANSIYRPKFFIDQDTTKIGNKVAGLNVHANDVRIFNVISQESVAEIIIAIADLDNETATALYEFYRPSGCKIKVYDAPLSDSGETLDSSKRRTIREFSIEDLLFRKPLTINNQAAFDYYTGKTVLVTGGGGSIGSELCRQIAKCKPAHLIVLDIYENNAYDLQQELIRKYGDTLNLSVEIGSVRDRERLECLFRAYRPNIVFHAAAHKHVPLMEHSNCEAIKNNVLGTFNTADMAEKYGVEKFILVSTDKAVNPTNIMGASKRMCEMVIQCRTDSNTKFAAVRFGNVLGSNGSVIPLFRRQIASGGPVTITDKRIIRYFMTIPEASQLVMQAGAMAKEGELFVLDMGNPVKILELAENMIRLSGFEPNKDIMIEEIGLRPGEKLFEELLIESETVSKTENKMIFIEKDTPLTREAVDEKLDMLRAAVAECKNEIEAAKIKEAMHKAVPTFRDPEKVNKHAAEAKEMQQAEQHSEE